jgi:DNA-binding PadR family transcriptional regulator
MLIKENQKNEKQIISEMKEHSLKNFLDLIVMIKLENQPSSGYDLILYTEKRFKMLLSAGTIYSLLYSLERKQFITGFGQEGRRVYKLTEQGNEVVKIIKKHHQEIEHFTASLLG